MYIYATLCIGACTPLASCTHSRPHSFLQRRRARPARECRMWEFPERASGVAATLLLNGTQYCPLRPYKQPVIPSLMNIIPHQDHVIKHIQITQNTKILRAKSCCDANFVVTGGTTGCRYDNLWYHRWQKKLASWQLFSGYAYRWLIARLQ